MPNKNDLKLDGKQVLWFNGEKYLVKETFKNTKQAKDSYELWQNKA